MKTMHKALPHSARTGEIIRKSLLVLMLVLMVVIEVWYRSIDNPTELVSDCYNSASRLCGAFVALIFMIEFSIGKILNPLGNRRLKAIIFILPALAVAINNFPWISMASGDCTIDAKFYDIIFYAFICLCVGLFEELAFRGCALMLLLKKRRKTRLEIFMAIFWSSIIFGIVHLANIFFASPGAVFLQIGYSALIGALCCIVLLETGNIWLCVFTHALYNFAGGVVPRLGQGRIWTSEEIAFTAVIGVAVAFICIWRFFVMPVERAEELFVENEEEKI